MTVRKKALEIVNKIYETLLRNDHLQSYDAAKQCALIAVDEIMKAIGWEEMELGVERDNYWDEVKQEINKL